jgi:hypothetical protein
LIERTVRYPKWAVALALMAPLFFARSAAADVTLVEQDGWQVFMNGRIQTFLNHNEGQGRPIMGASFTGNDANGGSVEIRGGGVETGEGVLPEYQNGTGVTAQDQGLVREMRIRSGFTGNVLGFGIRKQLNETTEILGYTAVTVGIDSVARRKFTLVDPDWRESFVRVTSSWGSFTAGRTLTLFSRGATEITYLYGYRYGLGFPGTVSNFSQSTAGSVGFGVLGNGFGAGLAYATPDLGGFQLSLGAYDAVGYPNTDLLNRERWPRGEFETIFARKFGSTGFFKLFVNGAWQRLYDRGGTKLSADVYGTGFGGRFEIGPLKIGLAGHWGKGVGVTYSLEPHQSVYHDDRPRQILSGQVMDPTYPNCTAATISACPPVKMRTVDGGYAQAQLAVLKSLDVRGGIGITRVHKIAEDRADWRDNDMDPNTPAASDGGAASGTDSVGHVTIRQQVGVGLGLTYHVANNYHYTVEYFRAVFIWYKPTPADASTRTPSQTLDFINAGVTYDF